MNTTSGTKFFKIIRVFLLALIALGPAFPAGAASPNAPQPGRVSFIQKNVSALAGGKPPRATTTPAPTGTPAPSTSPTATRPPKGNQKATLTPTSSPTPTAAPTNTLSPTPTNPPTSTPSPTDTVPPTPAPTETPSPTLPPTPTEEPTPPPVTGLAPIPVDPSQFLLDSTIQFKVNRTGITRVTYEEILSAGLDLNGTPADHILVANGTLSIPINVHTADPAGAFGPEAYIEFHAEALDSLYTDTNVYTLQVSQAAIAHIPALTDGPDLELVPPTAYAASATTHRQLKYDSTAPSRDPWGDTQMLTYTTSTSWDFALQADGLSDPAAPASLILTVWGITDWPQTPDHHLIASLNGTSIGDVTFDGHVEKTFSFPIPGNILTAGTNSLRLTLLGDLGASYDMVTLDQYTLTYRRTFSAVDGSLTFTATGKLFQVGDLPGGDVSVYRRDDTGFVRLANVQVQPSGTTYTAFFAGEDREATYYVSTADSIHTPVLEMTRPKVNLDQPAQYLIISHPDLIAELAPFIEAKQAQGLTVSMVNVDDLYDQYAYGVFDPEAIRRYIAHAAQDLGTQYVLLVGADSFDYRNRLGLDSLAYIPSLYTAVGSTQSVPADPLYTDIDNDAIPDLPIGRFPVHNTAELSLLINKTLTFASRTYANNALYVSDQGYMGDSNNLAARLTPGWAIQKIILDQIPAADGHTQLLAALNSNASLVNYLGHSSPATWGPAGFFDTAMARTLANAGRPFVVMTWGCYGITVNDPRTNSLAQSLLFSGEQGAAAIMGSPTSTGRYPEQVMALLFSPLVAQPGLSLGMAIQQAKTQYVDYANNSGMTPAERADILLTWTLMGDPALVIQP